uniref:Uncharacterized protein n=1 Tax=Kalmanozyma brasiliensis (strain GHG001) TaxID=1365824 RepID=V5GMG5_KALBG
MDSKKQWNGPLFISQIASEVDGFVLGQASAKSGAENAPWATLSCSGYPHAPLTWRYKVPFSSRYGAQELPGNKPKAKPTTELATQDESMTDASSSSEDEDADSDSSLDMGEQRVAKRKNKKRSKRTLAKNQTEHSFRPSTGETGWVSFALGPHQTREQAKPKSSRWVFVELIGTDTRS